MASYDHAKVAQYIGELSRTCSFGRVVDKSTGGNALDKAPAGQVHDFVKSHGGHTVITKVRALFP